MNWINWAELIVSTGLIVAPGVALAMLLKKKESPMPHPDDNDPPESTPAKDGFALVKPRLVREFEYIPGPYQRLEFLRLVQKECKELESQLGPQLHAAATK